jgi:peptidoglycan-N-acetylglucosamine deacetylase
MIVRLPARFHLVLTVAALGICLVIGSGQAAAPEAIVPQAATASKYVYLTFDDGPHPKYTAQILAILRSYGVRATFFEIGQNVAR